MNKTPELKPCPFCGGKAELLEDVLDAHVYCTECYARTTDTEKFVKDWKREVRGTWNTRVYPPEVQKAIERDKPRNPVRPKGYSNIECPTCGAHLKQYYEPEEANVPFCYHCGQRLDWGRDD